MPLAAFHAHWRTTHAELIRHLPGIRHYVQNYPPGGGQPAFDAVAESSFDDTQAMKSLAKSAEYAAVLADEPNFIDRASLGSIITEEHVLKDGDPRDAARKHLCFVRRKNDTPIDAFFASLLEHGRQAAQAPGIVRYTQCHTRRSAYDSGRTPAYDAVEMIWYGNAADAPADASGVLVTERVVL